MNCESVQENPRNKMSSIGSFSNDDDDGNENIKKATGLITKTSTLHVHYTFWYISLPSLHDKDVKFPVWTFYGGRKQTKTNFSFSFQTWIRFPRVQLQEISPTFGI